MSLVGIETRQTCTRSRHPSVLCRAIRSHPISQQVCEIQKVQEDSAPRATQSTERGNFSWHVCEITKVRKDAPLQSTNKVWVINSHIHQSVLFRAEGIWRLYASSRDWRSPNHKELKLESNVTTGLSPFKNCMRDIYPFASIFQGNNCFRLKYLEITRNNSLFIYLETSSIEATEAMESLGLLSGWWKDVFQIGFSPKPWGKKKPKTTREGKSGSRL